MTYESVMQRAKQIDDLPLDTPEQMITFIQAYNEWHKDAKNVGIYLCKSFQLDKWKIVCNQMQAFNQIASTIKNS